MAKIRIGFSTHFEIENELAGIGTDNPTNTKQVLGNIHATNTKAVGVSTFTTFDGFVDTKASISGLEGSEQGSLSGEIIIEGSATVSAGATFSSGPENLTVTDNFTLPGISDDKPSVGSTRFNENLASLEFYTGEEWRAVNSYVDMSGGGGRAVLGGGRTPSLTSVIQSYNIHTLGNATNFGNLSSARQGVAAFGSRIRAVYGGGYISPTSVNTIDYGDFQSGGTAADFGDMTAALAYRSGASSSTRGIFSTGYTGSANTNAIDYIQISTIGNGVDFGDAIIANRSPKALASPTRFVQAGGYTTGYHKGMEFLTISSLGNTVSFGDLSNRVFGPEGVSNNTRGIFAGGRDHTAAWLNNIDFITISSTGSTEYFGDLINKTTHSAGSSTNTRGVFCGGYTTGSPSYTMVEIMSFITLNSSGNSIDFGDLTTGTDMAGATSDSHGGLGGF